MFKCSLVHACRISCSLLYGCWRARVLLFVPKHFLLFNSLPVIAMTCCLLLVKIGENISMKSYCCPFRSATTQIVFSSTVTKSQHSWWVGWLDEPLSSVVVGQCLSVFTRTVFFLEVKCDSGEAWYIVTTCLENLEMSWTLTAVREMSGILVKVKEMSGKTSCEGKVA